LSWDPDPKALYTEVWEWQDPFAWFLPSFATIYTNCTYTNFISIPVRNFFNTNYFQVYDTNGTPIGWSSNIIDGDMFITVGCGYWNYRHTNITRISLQ
jgi:hypothetical protein